ELGRVRAVIPNATGARLEIESATVLDDATLGASIAVNGCCLTVVAFDPDDGWWAADAVEETLSRTCLGALGPGDPVNLERPVRLSDRLGGHLVQGHVDGVGRIRERTPLPDGSTRVGIEAPDHLLRYVVEKGSIAVDGVSLTVAGTDAAGFDFALIPHTATVTTLGAKGPGAPVNLEVDLVAKYIERLALGASGPPPGTGS
ncbi:MAG: riboflavin synthase, partial [Acidimicrobiia bacterium]